MNNIKFNIVGVIVEVEDKNNAFNVKKKKYEVNEFNDTVKEKLNLFTELDDAVADYLDEILPNCKMCEEKMVSEKGTKFCSPNCREAFKKKKC